ncbi:MAG: diacylglycerol kinase family protein [Acidimicrobiales bacterium]
MKILLIVNAAASSVTLRSRVLVQKALSVEHEVQVAETSRRGHAARLAQNAASQGVDLVVVFGGDGTLNEAANGLAGSESALAPLPGGSTNVFARTLGLSDDPVEATAAILDALSRGSTRRVGIGSVNRRYFLFHCGVGFDAAVVEQVERRSGLKRYAGHPLFIYAAMDTWLRHYDRKHPHFQVRFDDGSVVDDGYFAICCNTDPYTYLGSRPLHLAPDATLDSPLAMVTIRTLKLRRLGRLAGSALFAGGSRLRRSRHVDYRTGVRAMTVSSDHPFPYQVDGDYLGYVRSLEFRYEPDALRLIVP